MQLALVIAYFVVLTVLTVYGSHRLWIIWLYYRHRQECPKPKETFDKPPPVTVQLPIYNERYVAERLIRAVADIDYPNLEIQVLDDSTDDTVDLVAALVRALKERNVDIHHVRRPDRVGYKAGALAYGLKRCRGEFVAVFDADFIASKDFLARTVDFFTDETVGMVQVRWDHVNRNYSTLTEAQSVLLDGHFVVEHTARFRSGRFFNFNGTAGVWRKTAIEEAGGWQHDTLTEDLDLSYRAQQKGWRFVFLDDVSVPAEVPVDIAAFKSQQHRWAKGSIQTARKLLPSILRSDLPRAIRVEAFFHLTANCAYLLMLLLTILMPVTLFARVDRGWVGALCVDLPFFLFGTLSVCNFYVLSQRNVANSFWGRIKFLPLVLGLGVGMSLNNGRAVLEALLGHETGFVRTPKYNITDGRQTWQRKRYVNFKWVQPALELTIALWYVPAIVVALSHGGRALFSLPFLLLFQGGFLYVSLTSFAQSFQGFRFRSVRRHSSAATDGGHSGV